MPRAKKRPPPVPNVPTGLPYGQAQELERQRAALPAATTNPSTAAGGPPAAPPVDPRQRMQAVADQAVAAMQQRQYPGPILTRPSARTDEPVTAGLPVGAGPGPEALGAPRGRVADELARIARLTGDPVMAQYAEDAAARRL